MRSPEPSPIRNDTAGTAIDTARGKSRWEVRRATGHRESSRPACTRQDGETQRLPPGCGPERPRLKGEHPHAAIRRALSVASDGAGGKPVEFTPAKSGKARTVDLDHKTVESLLAHRDRQ